MTKYYAGESLEEICWKIFLIQKDIEVNAKDYSLKDKRRFSEAFQTFKNLSFQWKMEGKK